MVVDERPAARRRIGVPQWLLSLLALPFALPFLLFWRTFDTHKD